MADGADRREPGTAGGRPRPRPSGGRESVESFTLVFLFFLVLGVEAEGFVIPTGSMAPTLLGRHKDVTCPQCGLVYPVDGHREVEQGPGRAPPAWVEGGVCVNCRFPAAIGDEPNFQGDRIYVVKTGLSLPFLPPAVPRRWDVTVFKLPEEPEVRYVKRLVGMPGEVVRILRGDIWVGPPGGDRPFRRAYRPLPHQDAMQVLVHDDAHRPRSLAADPRWSRWAPKAPGAWAEDPALPGTYRAIGAGPGWSELRYRHVLPDPEQWAALRVGKPLPRPPRVTLITDFSSYNTDTTAEARSHPWAASKSWRQPHWVGDLGLRFRLDAGRPEGSVRVELVKAGVSHRCEIDLAAGTVALWRGDRRVAGPVGSGLRAPFSAEVAFANVDDRLTLRLDGRRPFGDGVAFAADPDAVAPNASDLDPVGLAARGASVTVRGLVLSRDIYYTLRPGRSDYESLVPGEPWPADPVGLADWLADPSRFGAFGRLGPADFPVGPGRYLMLGDNSPWSRDGRDWGRGDQTDPDRPGRGWDGSGRESWEVPEALVVGKALCVYWPHLKPFGPGFRLGPDVRLPARPFFEEMRWVR